MDEIVVDGMNSFIVNDVAEAVPRVNDVKTMDRNKIREVFEQDFTAQKMAEGYVGLYHRVIRDWEGRVALGTEPDDVWIPSLVDVSHCGRRLPRPIFSKQIFSLFVVQIPDFLVH